MEYKIRTENGLRWETKVNCPSSGWHEIYHLTGWPDDAILIAESADTQITHDPFDTRDCILYRCACCDEWQERKKGVCGDCMYNYEDCAYEDCILPAVRSTLYERKQAATRSTIPSTTRSTTRDKKYCKKHEVYKKN